MILREATIKYKGYDPSTLPKFSHKRICVSCDKCGRVRWIDNNAYRDLCRKCIQKERFNNPKIIKKYSKSKMGNKNPMYIKLNDDLICKEYENGITIVKLGKKYNCSSGTISRRLKNNNIKIRSRSKVQSGKNNSMYGKTGEDAPGWQGGLSKQKYCDLWTESFREIIRERFHRKCYLCNKDEIDNNRKLSVHHVNYDKNCLCQKTCEFVPLCSKCHTKTNFNRPYWENLIMNYLYPERYFMIEI